MPPQNVVCLTGYLYEPSESFRFLASHYIRKVGGQHKWCPFSLNTPFLLIISKEVPKVDMEESAILGYHHIVIVPITYAEDIRGYAVARTRTDEIIHRLLPSVLRGVMSLKPKVNGTFLEGSFGTEARLLANLSRGRGIQYHLDESNRLTCSYAAIWREAEIESFLLPQLIHKPYHLQSKHVLTKIVSCLEDGIYWITRWIRVFPYQP